MDSLGRVKRSQINLPYQSLLLVFFVGFFLSLFTVNPLLLVLSWLTLFILLFTQWSPNLPSVLFFALAYQWLAVSMKVLYGATQGISLEDLPATYFNSLYVNEAFIYSIIGLNIFALALFINKVRVSEEVILQHFLKYDTKKVLVAYLLLSFMVNLLLALRWSVGGLAEAISNLALIKWGFFVALFYLAQKKNEYTKIVYLILLFEVVLGFASYFSSFKVILFYLIIAFFWISKTIQMKKVPIYLIAGGMLFYFGIIWTAVKSDYREYVSGGKSIQKVTVSTTDALDQFFALTSSVEEETLDESMYALVDRVGYLDFFSLVIGNVPKNIPHEEGEVWSAAFTHVLKPRIFFPNKPSIDDSEHTRKYAGVMVANQQMGASHSLGYMVDAYIDFGPVFMYVPIFLFGLFAGYIYKNILLRSHNLFWGIVLSTPLFSLLSLFERNSIKVVAQLIMYFLVVWAFRTFVIPRIDHYLRVSI